MTPPTAVCVEIQNYDVINADAYYSSAVEWSACRPNDQGRCLASEDLVTLEVFRASAGSAASSGEA